MNYFLPQAKVVCPGSSWNGKITNLRLSRLHLISIGDAVSAEENDHILKKGLSISPGWVEMRAKFYDPGFPEKENLESGSKAAALGGYTHIGVLPHSLPTLDNRTGVHYIIEKSKNLPTKILPVGSLSIGMEGKDLAELFDLKEAGCIAFSDGGIPIENTVFLKIAMHYAASTDSVVFLRPDDAYLSALGDVREGINSTLAGIHSIPEVSETIGIERIARLIEYTSCRVHFTSISTLGGLEVLKSLKKLGLNVTSDVSVAHLLFTDDEILNYDSNFKIFPPLGNAETQSRLIEAVKSGLIDTVSADHDPHEIESKKCEFHHAKAGISSLQAAFSMLIQAIPDLDENTLINLLSIRPREILRLGCPSFEEGEKADYTLYQLDGNTIYTNSNWASNSENFPSFEKELKGRVEMTIMSS